MDFGVGQQRLSVIYYFLILFNWFLILLLLLCCVLRLLFPASFLLSNAACCDLLKISDFALSYDCREDRIIVSSIQIIHRHP
jgi:hypothetical protein